MNNYKNMKNNLTVHLLPYWQLKKDLEKVQIEKKEIPNFELKQLSNLFLTEIIESKIN